MSQATDEMQASASTRSSIASRQRCASARLRVARMNDFMRRRHGEHEQALSERGRALPRPRVRGRARPARTSSELLEELERLRALEEFLKQQGERFRGGDEQADYETAQEVREQIEALQQMAQDLAERQLRVDLAGAAARRCSATRPRSRSSCCATSSRTSARGRLPPRARRRAHAARDPPDRRLGARRRLQRAAQGARGRARDAERGVGDAAARTRRGPGSSATPSGSTSVAP